MNGTTEITEATKKPEVNAETVETVPRPPVAFCLPAGRRFNADFLMCWSRLLVDVMQKGMTFRLNLADDSMVHFARSRCLQGDALAGPDQAPFQGSPYDFAMWIDSDIFFTTEAFLKLVESPHDVTSGLYHTRDGKHYAAGLEWDDAYYARHGRYRFLSNEKHQELLEEKTRYVGAAWAGMGWMLVRAGVFEKIGYPWFTSEVLQVGGLRDLCSEDVTFCRRLQEKGIQVYLDIEVVVGHMKECII